MANVTLFSSFNFLAAQDWDFSTTTANATTIVIQNFGLGFRQTFTGNFTYTHDPYLGEDVVNGTVTSTSFAVNGTTVYSVTGMSKDAYTLMNYANTTGDTQATYAYVLSGADSFAGSPGNDTLLGYAGNDTLSGAGGNDSINGGPGADVALGGSGDDSYTVDNALDKVFESTTTNSGIDAGGTDTVRSSVAFTLGSFIEKLILTGSQAINGKGNALSNSLTGNGGANTLTGLVGNDTLLGGGGSDTLVGGAGKDSLRGGAGADVFAYNSVADSGNATTNRDSIADFVAGSDRIDLSAIDANPATGASNNAFTFIGSAPFGSDATGQLRFEFNASTGNLVVQGSTDADSTPEFSIVVLGISSLTAANFVL
jgi:Ca2+-binding RTX toxin-like protein